MRKLHITFYIVAFLILIFCNIAYAMFCSKCGVTLKDDDNFCPKCGKKIEINSTENPPDSSIQNQNELKTKFIKLYEKWYTNSKFSLSIGSFRAVIYSKDFDTSRTEVEVDGTKMRLVLNKGKMWCYAESKYSIRDETDPVQIKKASIDHIGTIEEIKDKETVITESQDGSNTVFTKLNKDKSKAVYSINAEGNLIKIVVYDENQKVKQECNYKDWKFEPLNDELFEKPKNIEELRKKREELGDKIIALVKDKDYAGALKIINYELDHDPYHDPDTIKVWLELKASLLCKLELYENAILCADLVLKQDPKARGALESKYSSLYFLKKNQEALNCVNFALENYPDDLTNWVSKFLIQLQCRQCEESLTTIDKAIRMSPNNALLWYYKALALNGLKRNQEALECANKAVEIEPQNSSYVSFKNNLDNGIFENDIYNLIDVGAKAYMIYKSLGY